MNEHEAIPHLREIVVFLVAAGIVVPALSQLRITRVLGYLLIGAVIGPFGLGLLAADVPWLGVAAITDLEGVRALAEFGVIFLLFMIGLELSIERLWSMRRLVFGLGSLQILVTGAVIGAVAWGFGNSAGASVILGACLALSSTAIVMQLLIEQRRLGTDGVVPETLDGSLQLAGRLLHALGASADVVRQRLEIQRELEVSELARGVYTAPRPLRTGEES